MLKQLRKKSIKPVTQVLIEAVSVLLTYIVVNTSQLLDKKIIRNVKTPQYLGSFRLSTTGITSEDNLPLQVEEIVSDDTEHSFHKKFVR